MEGRVEGSWKMRVGGEVEVKGGREAKAVMGRRVAEVEEAEEEERRYDPGLERFGCCDLNSGMKELILAI